MKNDKIFTGTIMRCTKYDMQDTFKSEMFINGQNLGRDFFGYIDVGSEIFKENAILIKTKYGYYVDVDGLSLADIAYLYFENSKAKVLGTTSDKLFMLTSGFCVGDLFVDQDSIKSYTSANMGEKRSSILSIQGKTKNKRTK